MTHSSGIIATSELKNVINQAKTGQIRLIKISITSENLILDKAIKPTSHAWQKDFDKLVLPCLNPDQPCYLLYRLDSRHTDGSPEWILMTYVPESTPTRQKMIYASTKMTMKKTISGLHIQHEISATTVSECSYEGFQQHLTSLSAPKPLTQAEKELLLIKQNEEEMRNQGKRQTLQSVSFPVTPDLSEALSIFKSGRINYIQISLDIQKEVITLVSANQLTVDQLKQAIPTQEPRYNLYSFNLPNGTYHVVFIHSIPIGKSSIKEKMLYSTCKIPFLQHVESNHGILISKKIETDTPDEITPEYLVEQVTVAASQVGANKQFKNNSPAFQRFGSPSLH